MTEIQTPRLRLLALDLRHLRLLRQQRSYMEESLGLNPMILQMDSEMAIEVRQAIDFWLINVESHPQHYAWYTNWEIILKAENCSIGGIGLSGRPDAEGKVMVGYVIDDRYHNRGFATESLGHLVAWAEADPTLQFLTAETPVDNYASQRVLVKNGFEATRQFDQSLLWERPNRSNLASGGGRIKEVKR